jgi:predicted nucleic acid-binding protein
LRAHDPRQARHLEAWFQTVREDFADRVLPITPTIAEQWGRFNAVRTLPVIDGLLAATAKAHGLTSVTRNTPDVRGLGVLLVDPFRPESSPRA